MVKRSSGGIRFGGLLQVAFIVLKLCGVIEWSWWWVLAPMWITVIVTLGLIVVAIWLETGFDFREEE